MEYLLKKHCWEIETLIFLNFLQHVHVFYLKSCCFIAEKYNVNVRSSVALFMALQVLKLSGGQTVHVQKCVSEKSIWRKLALEPMFSSAHSSVSNWERDGLSSQTPSVWRRGRPQPSLLCIPLALSQWPRGVCPQRVYSAPLKWNQNFGD